jgi:hypothetical protein
VSGHDDEWCTRDEMLAAESSPAFVIEQLRLLSCRAGQPHVGDDWAADHGHTSCWVHGLAARMIARLVEAAPEATASASSPPALIEGHTRMGRTPQAAVGMVYQVPVSARVGDRIEVMHRGIRYWHVVADSAEAGEVVSFHRGIPSGWGKSSTR